MVRETLNRNTRATEHSNASNRRLACSAHRVSCFAFRRGVEIITTRPLASLQYYYHYKRSRSCTAFRLVPDRLGNVVTQIHPRLSSETVTLTSAGNRTPRNWTTRNTGHACIQRSLSNVRHGLVAHQRIFCPEEHALRHHSVNKKNNLFNVAHRHLFLLKNAFKIIPARSAV
jgi:hypothetical protein